MTADTELYTMMGELKGQMREVVHSVNNLSQKVDAITRENSHLPGEVSDLKARVKILEEAEHRRTGATNLGLGVFKSGLFGNIVTGVVTALGVAWLVMKEKIGI